VTCSYDPCSAFAIDGNQQALSGVVALDRVDLEVHPAEVVALIGENGAGKSTLMKILGGVTQPDDGVIRLESRELQIQSPREASQLGIEFIHQELSVLDNLDKSSRR
jgi:ABC-type sugar transport system ATPase subunit